MRSGTPARWSGGSATTASSASFNPHDPELSLGRAPSAEIGARSRAFPWRAELYLLASGVEKQIGRAGPAHHSAGAEPMVSVPQSLMASREVDPDRLRRRRALRLRMQSMVAISYGVDAVLLL